MVKQHQTKQAIKEKQSGEEKEEWTANGHQEEWNEPFDQEKPQKKAKKQEEKFYVLENAYQQLVFSNYGGALARNQSPFCLKRK